MKSRKTTITAIVAAFGLLGAALSDGWQTADIAVLFEAAGLVLVGYFARDDNVTSEGTRAPKSIHKDEGSK